MHGHVLLQTKLISNKHFYKKIGKSLCIWSRTWTCFLYISNIELFNLRDRLQGQNSGGCSFFYYNTKKPSWFILNWQIYEYNKENMTNTVVEIKCTSFILKILKWMHVNFILAITLVFYRYLTLLNYSTEKIMKKTLKSYMAFAN